MTEQLYPQSKNKKEMPTDLKLYNWLEKSGWLFCVFFFFFFFLPTDLKQVIFNCFNRAASGHRATLFPLHCRSLYSYRLITYLAVTAAELILDLTSLPNAIGWDRAAVLEL